MARILFVDTWTELGGGQRLLLDLVGALKREGHVCAAAFPADGNVPAQLRSQGVETFVYELPTLPAGPKAVREKLRFLAGTRRAADSLASVGRRFRADALFCIGGRPALPATLAARRLRIKVAFFVQLIYGGMERRLLAWCFRRPEVTGVAFCSSAAAAPFGSLRGKATTVWNWVSPSFLGPLPQRAASDPVVVGVLGRISPTKGQTLFLEALLPLLVRHRQLRLAIGGSTDFEQPGEEDRIRELVEQAPEADRVELHGAVDALEFLDRLDVLAVPSVWEEPFGLVAVEGMARGLPVVATRSGALSEIVLDGVTGFVVERNPSDLRAAVESLVADPTLRRDFGAAGRARAERVFDPARKLPLIIELIERAAAGSPAPAIGSGLSTKPTA